MNNKLDLLKKMTTAGIAIGAILFLFSLGQIFETNQSGYFQIKQAAFTGKMSAKLDEGVYLQSFGEIWTYKNVTTVGFGDEIGEANADLDAIEVIFNDGSKATISGLVRVKLPRTETEVLALKNEYPRGYDAFIKEGIVPIVKNAVKLSANLRSAQDAYTTLAIFQQAVEDQLKNGIYVTKTELIKRETETGDSETVKLTSIVTDPKTGEPKRLSNRLLDLGCEVTEVVIDVPKFDAKVEEMIARRKDEAMKTELAKQSAIRAKQDAITATEQGRADVAKAEAEALVEKKKEVVEAEKVKEVAELEARKKFEVEKLAALEALERAKKIRAEGLAKAAANEALVKAGLTPEQAALIKKDTVVEAMREWAKRPVPTHVITTGSGGSNSSSGAGVMMDIMGTKAAMDLINGFGK